MLVDTLKQSQEDLSAAPAAPTESVSFASESREASASALLISYGAVAPTTEEEPLPPTSTADSIPGSQGVTKIVRLPTASTDGAVAYNHQAALADQGEHLIDKKLIFQETIDTMVPASLNFVVLRMKSPATSQDLIQRRFQLSDYKVAISEFLTVRHFKRYPLTALHYLRFLRGLKQQFDRRDQQVKSGVFRLVWFEAVALFAQAKPPALDNTEDHLVEQLIILGLQVFREFYDPSEVLLHALAKLETTPYKAGTYFPLLQEQLLCYSQVGQTERVFEIFGLLRKGQFKPNSTCYAAAFDSFRKLNAIDRAHSVYLQLERFGFLYQSPLTKHLVYICGRKNQPKQILTILKNVKEARRDLTSEDFADAVRGLLDANNYAGAVALEPQLRQFAGRDSRMEQAWFYLLKYAMQHSEDPVETCSWFKKLASIHPAPHERRFDRGSAGAMRAYVFHLGHQLLIHFLSKPWDKQTLDVFNFIFPLSHPPNMTTIQQMIRAVGQRANLTPVQQAEVVLRFLSPFEATLVTNHGREAATLFLSLHASALHDKTVRAAFQSMVRNNWPPDADICNAIMRMRVQKGDATGSLDMYEEMQQNGIAPNSVTYNLLLSLYASRGLFAKVDDLVAEMQKDKVVFTGDTLAVMLQGLIRTNKAKEALAKFDQIFAAAWGKSTPSATPEAAAANVVADAATSSTGQVEVEGQVFATNFAITADLIGTLLDAAVKAREFARIPKLFEIYKKQYAVTASASQVPIDLWVNYIAACGDSAQPQIVRQALAELLANKPPLHSITSTHTTKLVQRGVLGARLFSQSSPLYAAFAKWVRSGSQPLSASEYDEFFKQLLVLSQQ